MGYIPHVDSNRCICTYPPDTVVLDIAKPEGIVLQCLRQARVNIADGVNGKNEDDFNDEYLAYWKQTYPGEQEPIKFCLNLIETEIDTVCFIKYGAFKYPAGKYKNCLYLEDNDFRRVKENLNNSLNNDIIEVNDALLFPDFPKRLGKPPFTMTYGDTAKIIEGIGKEASNKFEKYINKWNIFRLYFSGNE